MSNTERWCRRCGYESELMHAITIDNRLIQHPQRFNHGGSTDSFWLCMSCETDFEMFMQGCDMAADESGETTASHEPGYAASKVRGKI